MKYYKVVIAECSRVNTVIQYSCLEEQCSQEKMSYKKKVIFLSWSVTYRMHALPALTTNGLYSYVHFTANLSPGVCMCVCVCVCACTHIMLPHKCKTAHLKNVWVVAKSFNFNLRFQF